MLPPGIFLLKSGNAEKISPLTPALLSATHPLWAADVQKYGPWNEAIDVEGLGQALKGSVQSESSIVVTGSSVTTMETARLCAEKGILQEWGSVISVEQAQGRGQLRRPWVSSPGNLHASVVMPGLPKSGPWSEVLSGLLPLVAGSVFSSILHGLGCDIRIKWPNDLLQDNRKVGGMLIEEKNGLVILGVGINLVTAPTDDLMREDCSVPAGVLRIPNGPGGALALWETLVSRGKCVYRVLLDELGPSQFIAKATDQLAWFGRNIVVREGTHDSYQAVIVGLSSSGGLVLRRDGKEVVLFSGSISPL